MQLLHQSQLFCSNPPTRRGPHHQSWDCRVPEFTAGQAQRSPTNRNLAANFMNHYHYVPDFHKTNMERACWPASVFLSLFLTAITRFMVGGLRNCQKCHSSDQKTLVIGHVNVFSHVTGGRVGITPMYMIIAVNTFSFH